jgi:hypothetical protein
MSTIPMIKAKKRGTCGECKWFESVPNPMNAPIGLCHRYPPQVVGFVITMKGPSGKDEEQPRNNTHWPVVSNDSYCGEFTLNLLAAEMN